MIIFRKHKEKTFQINTYHNCNYANQWILNTWVHTRILKKKIQDTYKNFEKK